MKRPALDQEQRFTIIHNTLYGAQLNVWLKKEIWIREMCKGKDWITKLCIRRVANKIRIR